MPILIDAWIDNHPWILPVTIIPMLTALFVFVTNKLKRKR